MIHNFSSEIIPKYNNKYNNNNSDDDDCTQKKQNSYMELKEDNQDLEDVLYTIFCAEELRTRRG